MKPMIEAFFDERTNTLTYVVWDDTSGDAVVIDPVLDYEPKGSKVWSESVDDVIEFVRRMGLNLCYILETHAHADHLSGSQLIKAEFPNAKVGIGEDIRQVQKTFKMVFGLPADFPTDGSQFDVLLKPGKTFQAGSLTIETIATPGHTPACVTYRIGENLFTGDTLFMPDQGTGRCDFPGGSADALYTSVHEVLYRLPNETKVFVGHDYQPGGRELAYQTTIGEQKSNNVALPDARRREDFVKWRTERDQTLDAPQLLFQSVQVNVDAGALPKPEQNEVSYLKIPINVFRTPPRGDAPLTLEKVG